MRGVALEPARAGAPRTRSRRRAAYAVLLGGVIAGTLDIAYAIAFWWLKAGVNPVRILQSVAAGLVGPAAARGGGAATGVLGGVLQLVIAVTMASVYYAVSTRWRALIERPWAWGALYGLALFGAMNYVVVPLSRARWSPPSLSLWVVCSVVVHVVAIGIPCALASRAAHRAA